MKNGQANIKKVIKSQRLKNSPENIKKYSGRKTTRKSPIHIKKWPGKRQKIILENNKNGRENVPKNGPKGT